MYISRSTRYLDTIRRTLDSNRTRASWDRNQYKVEAAQRSYACAAYYGGQHKVQARFSKGTSLDDDNDQCRQDVREHCLGSWMLVSFDDLVWLLITVSLHLLFLPSTLPGLRPETRITSKLPLLLACSDGPILSISNPQGQPLHFCGTA